MPVVELDERTLTAGELGKVLGTRLVLLGPGLEQAIPEECPVSIQWWSLIAKRLEQFSRLLLQHLWWIRERRDVEKADTAARHDDGGHPTITIAKAMTCGSHCSASLSPAAATISRRRRLAGGERRGQRVAAGQRRRDCQRRRRPVARDPCSRQRTIARSIGRIDIARPRDGVDGMRTATCWRSSSPTVSASNGAAAGEHLVQHQAERVDVALDRRPRVRPAARAPCRPACRSARRLDSPVSAGEAEVRDADPPRAVDHHVGRLEVAMQHAALVRRREAGAELPRDLDRLVLRQPADAPQQRRQVLAVDVLHREERCPSTSPMS